MRKPGPANPEIIPAGIGGCCFEWKGVCVYVDPSEKVRRGRAADIICLSRSDPSAAQRSAVEAIAKPTTIVAGAPACVGLFRLNQLPFSPGQKRTVLGLEVEALDDGKGGLGFAIVAGGSRGVFKEGTWVDAGAVAGRAAAADVGTGTRA
jgi:hypothetical protein